MTVTGTVRDGKIVLPAGVSLPDGVEIAIEVPESALPDSVRLSNTLLELAGSIEGLPEDLSAQHGHYVHGVPKK